MELSEIRELLANDKKKAAMAEIRKIAGQYCVSDKVTCYTREGLIFVRATDRSVYVTTGCIEAIQYGLNQAGFNVSKEMFYAVPGLSGKSAIEINLTDFLR